MTEVIGWLLDVYAEEDGITLWLLTDDGKRLHLRHLSPDCLDLLTKAKDMVEIDVREDPHYHIADNKLG